MFTSLRTKVARDYETMSQAAARMIEAEVRLKPELLLCASAGGTPSRTYELLAAHRNSAQFGKMRVLQIDEWGGIPASHPATCKVDLERKLIEPLGLPARSFIGMKSDSGEPEREARRIRSWLRRNGPIDLCILGLGTNGHVAMNEPGESALPHAHVATLAKSSLQHAMLKELSSKPSYGLTLGLADILASRKILLLVNGERKAAILRQLLEPRLTTRLPASFLWLHRDTTILCDRAAACKLRTMR